MNVALIALPYPSSCGLGSTEETLMVMGEAKPPGDAVVFETREGVSERLWCLWCSSSTISRFKAAAAPATRRQRTARSMPTGGPERCYQRKAGGKMLQTLPPPKWRILRRSGEIMECNNIHNRQWLPAQNLPVPRGFGFVFSPLTKKVLDMRHHLSHVQIQPRLLSSEYLRLDLRSLRCP